MFTQFPSWQWYNKSVLSELPYTVNVVIFSGGEFRQNVGKTSYMVIIFTILHLFQMCKIWKWLGKNCGLYRAHKVLYTGCRRWHWPCDLKLIGFLLSSATCEVWTWLGKKLACIVPTKFYTQSAKFDLDFWPLTQN